MHFYARQCIEQSCRQELSLTRNALIDKKLVVHVSVLRRKRVHADLMRRRVLNRFRKSLTSLGIPGKLSANPTLQPGSSVG